MAGGVRWSLSESFADEDQARDWIEGIQNAASMGIDPRTFTMVLTDYGHSVMDLATRGLEGKTLDPYLAGWRLRVVPAWGTYRSG